VNRCPSTIGEGTYPSYRCVLVEGHDGLHLAPREYVEWGIEDADSETVAP
jgi:hypothetical protein